MDEDTWDGLAPWRRTPMWCKNRPPTKEQLNRDADRWEDLRNIRKRTRPATSAEHGYRKPFTKNRRKIGFQR
jgi:hypothetical protein